MVSLVAWFTLVLEANCIRQPVSLLFPPLLLILKQGKEEETTNSCPQTLAEKLKSGKKVWCSKRQFLSQAGPTV